MSESAKRLSLQAVFAAIIRVLRLDTLFSGHLPATAMIVEKRTRIHQHAALTMIE